MIGGNKPVVVDKARQLEKIGEPWVLRLEYHGANYNNQSCRSDKWWEISGNGSGVVKCNFGATGSRGRPFPLQYTMGRALLKVREKLSKGYGYAPGTDDTDVVQQPQDRPQTMADLPEPYRSIKRIVALEGDLFRALDRLGNTVMDLDREGKDQLTAFNPWIVVG